MLHVKYRLSLMRAAGMTGIDARKMGSKQARIGWPHDTRRQYADL